jgi:tetratricopeptide (TPR) repeat protein
MPANEVDERTKTVAQMYFQLKNYDKAIAMAKKALQKQPNQSDLTLLLGQSYYLMKDYKSAASTMANLVSSAERAGQTPKEDWMRIVHASNHEMNNQDGVADSLKKLVRYYQKPEDWDGLLSIYSRKNHPDRVLLGYYRLMLDANVLRRPADFVETAQLAMDAGVPGEAQQVMEKGAQSGVLKSDDKTQQGKYDRLLDGAKKSTEASRASLPTLTKTAATAPTGQSDVQLGHVYLSFGQYDEAIGALQRGIRKGGVTDTDEAQVSLGIAYMRKGQKDLARQAFKSVAKDSKWGELAELWSLRV